MESVARTTTECFRHSHPNRLKLSEGDMKVGIREGANDHLLGLTALTWEDDDSGQGISSSVVRGGVNGYADG